MSKDDDAAWATLGLRKEAAVFDSAAQKARVLTEGWVAASLFCPNCGAQPISQFAANPPVADFLCDTCRREYELKSQKARRARGWSMARSPPSPRLAAEAGADPRVMRDDRRVPRARPA